MNLNTIQDPLTFANTLIKRIPKNVKIAIVIALVFAFLIHGFILTNDLPNHDDLGQTYTNYKYYVTLGRWFNQVPAAISSSFSLPWLCGVLGFIYLSFSLGLIVHIWNIQSIFYVFLSSLIFVSFPSIFETIPYTNNFDAYSFGFLLACASVYLTIKYKYGFIGGIVLLCLSLAVYQVYFPVAAVLYVGLLVIDFLKNTDQKLVIRKAIFYFLILAAAMALYLLSVKISLSITNSSLREYRGLETMGQIELLEIPNLIGRAYQAIIKFYVTDYYSIHNHIVSKVFLLFLIMSVILLLILIIKSAIKKSPIKIVLLLLLSAVIPLSVSLIHIMIPKSGIYIMNLFAYSTGWIFLFALLENLNRDALAFETYRTTTTVSAFYNCYRWLSVILVLGLAFNYIVVANVQYQQHFFAYENTFAFYSRLTSTIQSMDGYNDESTLFFIGKPQSKTYLPKEYKTFKHIVGIRKELVSASHTDLYLKYYMAFPNDLVKRPLDDLNEVELKIIDDMNVYPNSNSIKITDEGIFVLFEN